MDVQDSFEPPQCVFKGLKAMKQSHPFSINLNRTSSSVSVHSYARSHGQQTVFSKARRLCRYHYWTKPIPVNTVTLVVADCRPFPTYSILAYLPQEAL